MKLSVLAVTLAATAFLASNALAQMAPQVTMQPIPNPADKAAKAHKTSHKPKSHKASAKKTAEAPKTDDAAAAAPAK